MTKEDHHKSLDEKYRKKQRKLVGVDPKSPTMEIVGGALKKFTPAVVWGTLGLILATIASVWSLYVS